MTAARVPSSGPGRVLLVHNAYLHRGGEDLSVEILKKGLEDRGVRVDVYSRDNREIEAAGFARKMGLAAQAVFSWDSYGAMRRLLRENRPDVVHVHNVFPLISPSVYWAAGAAGVPVVQTLHNFRYFCVNGLFLRGGVPCERCAGGNVLHAVAGRCYRNDLAQSAVMASGLLANRLMGSWHKNVDAFIALSRFSMGKMTAGGLPAESIFLAPNFIDVRGRPAPAPSDGGLAFVGRLSREKGVLTLLRAHEIFAEKFPSVPLHLVGDGPLRGEVEAFLKTRPHLKVVRHGPLFGEAKDRVLSRAAALVFPSECYENCPYIVLESLACGVPVAASRIGGVPELISEGKTGVFFTAGDAASLAGSLEALFSDPGRLSAMRGPCRAEAEARFDGTVGMAKTLEIYRHAMSGEGPRPEAAAV